MIDILVLNYNDALTTTTFVDSVKDFPSVRKVLVVDNHSSDDSLENLKLLQDDKVIVVQTEKNGGYGAGNNFGVRYLYDNYKSEYILLCNPDVIVTNEVCEKLESFLRDYQDFAIAAPLMLNPKGKIQNHSACKIPTKWEYIFSLIACLKKYVISFDCGTIYGKEKKFFYEVGTVAGSLFLMNAKKMIQYGMYDENVFLYCEEIILGIKMKENHQKIALLPNINFIHNHSTSISKSYKSSFKRHKLLLSSKLYVIRHYFNARFIDNIIAFFVGIFSFVELFLVEIKNKVR